MFTFVLVHGAWHGGWCWRPVQKLLESKGHRVVTPTMIGLGERAHLLSSSITLDTLVTDIADVIEREDLSNVVLVGHSFGGAVISGVAERKRDRINQLIYLDAAILEAGETMFGCMSIETAIERRQQAYETSKNLSLPIPTAENLGIKDPKHWSFLEQHLTPHPLSSYDSPMLLEGQPGDGFICSYIVCSEPYYPPLAWARERAERYGWAIIPIATGHNAMVTEPIALTSLLLVLAYGTRPNTAPAIGSKSIAP